MSKRSATGLSKRSAQKVIAGFRVDQLCVHSQPAATMLHRALERVADVQLTPNLLETDLITFVAERSMSTDHE
jgi:hypothetical protein